MKKIIYSYAEIIARDRAELCAKLNKRIGRRERVFSIEFMASFSKGIKYGVIFEQQPELPIAKLRAFRIKKARAART